MNNTEVQRSRQSPSLITSAYIKNKLVKKENKIHELKKLIGNRTNIFGSVLQEKEQLYQDTISHQGAMDIKNHQNKQSFSNLRSSNNSIQDLKQLSSKVGSYQDIHVNTKNTAPDFEPSYDNMIYTNMVTRGSKPIAHISSQKVINTTYNTGVDPDHLQRRVFDSGNIVIRESKDHTEPLRKYELDEVQFLVPETPSEVIGNGQLPTVIPE